MRDDSRTHLQYLSKIKSRHILGETFFFRNSHAQIPTSAIRHDYKKMRFIAHDNVRCHDVTFAYCRILCSMPFREVLQCGHFLHDSIILFWVCTHCCGVFGGIFEVSVRIGQIILYNFAKIVERFGKG